MNKITFYNAGTSQANDFAVAELKRLGYTFCTADHINEATHILMDTPSAQELPSGTNRSAVVIGGNISFNGCLDLLQDPEYIAQNAMLTAHCAVKIAIRENNRILAEQKFLIIGWGRIGKCLAQLLKSMGCPVTVAVRKESDHALLGALGYECCMITEIDASRYDIIFNTAPALIIDNYNAAAIVYDLASTPGIVGNNVIGARGLPKKEAPASSGKLIAKTIHRLLNVKENGI